ncbi:MAG: phosphatidate cytidylyltransferase [Prevotellaceae bacterium]|jgi:phosphatidate cytidylyltransferase|nr:phosphatidate cytidylyltransferase [Prevotellaceae bacterium]
MNNFVTRTASGLVFIVLLLAGLIAHPFGFALLMLAIIIIGMKEFYAMSPSGRFAALDAMGYIAGASTFGLFFSLNFWQIQPTFFLLLTLPALAIFIVELYSKSRQPSLDIANVMLGILYVALPFSLMNLLVLRSGNYDYRLLLSFFIFLWTNDVGAYCFGVLFGRHKLFERISPKKSWEGFFGGLIATLAAALVLSSIWGESYGAALPAWLIFAAVVSITCTFGDLVESMFKRSAGLKDSGTIMPGHGGVLDRFDGALTAFPCALTYIEISGYFG